MATGIGFPSPKSVTFIFLSCLTLAMGKSGRRGSDMGKRYVIFSASYPPHMGGAETFTRNAAVGLAKRGHDVCVVANDANNCGTGITSEDGFDVLRLPCFPLVNGRLPIPKKDAEWLKTFGIEARGVIPNAIDACGYRVQASGRDFRTELDLGERAFVICFVGRLIPEKGVSSLVRTSRSPEIRAKGIVFVIAGEGPLKNEVVAASGSSLKYVGRLNQPDVAALLMQSDLMCLPSRSGGFSTSLLEASACGCPCLVTDVGGARELIPDEAHGTSLPSMDSEDVKASILELFSSPRLLETQSANTRELIENGFSWESTANKLELAMASS